MEMTGRRAVLAGFLATGALALPGCATIGRPSQTDLIESLLMLSSQRAFARLTQPDGFWDSQVARINLPVLFGRPGSVAQKVFRSPLFKEKLQRELNRVAEDGARVAAPLVYDAVRSLTVTDALALLRGGDTAATTFLRQSMGSGLVNVMIPELDRVMRVAEDPILNTAVSALAGVNMADAAHALALEADNAIWYEIGAQEADIRAHPESTHDAGLIAALKAASAL
ncbi:hypothetical protein A8V01_04310 [Novosphingobium guangzhouense]|uniref:DUF4197 domain-containing protein n=2 Tax=Novosphingobium guangzhouense TaxID=1850347 RepID=A0A2K2G201_9SPHN|nr:hypothetical protein A8V01_04310 [Novosphingobium guangzhouense]